MQKTTNLNLNKPETTDFYDVDDFNENADILDSAINTINTTLNGLSTVATSGSYNDLTDKPDAYTLPKASTTTLGGIKVGDNLSIDSNGVLSADGDATIILETEAEYEALSEAEKLAGTYLIKESNEETIGASVIPYDSSVSVKTKIDAIDTKLNNNLIESDSFNSSHTYSIGDMFNCDGKLYKVKVACSGVTPPNSTYYDEYTLTSELSALNNSLTKLITIGNGTTNATVNTTSSYPYPSGVSKTTHALVCAEVLCSGNWRSDQLANVYMGDNGLACAPISSVATSQPLRIVYLKIS